MAGTSPRSIGLANLEIWFDYMDPEFQKIGMFYSNPNTILYNLRPREDSGGFLLKHYLWIAQYYYKLLNGQILQPIQHCSTVEDIGARKPQTYGWKTFTFWQFGTPSVGLKFGMESREIDLDVFNGTIDELRKFCGVPIISNPELSDSDKLKRLMGCSPRTSLGITAGTLAMMQPSPPTKNRLQADLRWL